MEYLQPVRNGLAKIYVNNSRMVQVLGGFVGLYGCYKLYKSWRYSRKLFNSPSEFENKVVIITGCDTGFGKALALTLSIKLGYRVIATCLKQESVDKFLSNSSFTQNHSTAVVMDVSKMEQIDTVKQFTIKYLNDNADSILWGIVNNAGFSVPGQFELVPKEIDNLQRDVLLNGPMNIIREFLPLIHGRKEYEKDKTRKYNINDGGRIINIASCYAKIIGDTRYGVCKTALSYWSHALRSELSPRFGIWCCSVEPGGFTTGIWSGALIWAERVKQKLIENNESELMDIYGFDTEKIKRSIAEMQNTTNPLFDPVVDDIVHGLTSKYPEREYKPGWNWLITILAYAPFGITERLTPSFN